MSAYLGIVHEEAIPHPFIGLMTDELLVVAKLLRDKLFPEAPRKVFDNEARLGDCTSFLASRFHCDDRTFAF